LARRRGASLQVYRHRDAEHLSDLLGASDAKRKLIVTDGVFSMDGDLAPIPELVALRDEHGALLVVDDAHGTLVLGERGGGTAEHFGCEDAIDLHIGTLSKAAGALGGFIAGSEELIDLLLNEARTFVFSTALPLPVVAAARAAIEVATGDSGLRERVFGHVEFATASLGVASSSPIVPLVVGEAEPALELSDWLLERGFHIPAIRPPTVPEGSSRLRIALSAAHDRVVVEALISCLGERGFVSGERRGLRKN
jgi:8-amino-7-oxononanoate synthase